MAGGASLSKFDKTSCQILMHARRSSTSTPRQHAEGANMSENEDLGAMTVREFCERYRLGHTLVYEMIKDGRLRAVKCGERTLILARDVKVWEQSLRPVH
jgi:excisionase family DNA binding protein